MKQIIITIVIAVITGVSGYFLGVKKADVASATVSIVQEETSEEFISETVFQINPYGTMSDALGGNRMMTRHFFETQFQILKSQETISRAIQDYDLEKLLGKSKQESVKEIAGSIECSQVRGTDLIKLNVLADSEQKAQQIAYAVMRAYANRRTEALDRRRVEAINIFKDKRRIQEDKVEAHRARLYALSKRLKIPYHGQGVRADDVRGSDASKEKVDQMVSAEEKTKFGKTREDYEREMAILDAIKQAEFTEMLGVDLRRDPLVFHQLGWTPEVAAAMKLRE